jgi:hypothetical protein
VERQIEAYSIVATSERLTFRGYLFSRTINSQLYVALISTTQLGPSKLFVN